MGCRSLFKGFQVVEFLDDCQSKGMYIHRKINEGHVRASGYRNGRSVYECGERVNMSFWAFQ